MKRFFFSKCPHVGLLLSLMVLLCLESSAQNGKNIHNSASTSKINALLDSCWQQRNTNPEASRALGLKAIALAKKANDPSNLMRAYSFTGVAYRNIGYFDEAIRYYSLGFDMAQELNDIEQMCYGYINLGNLHFYLKEPDKALTYLEQVHPLLKTIENKNIEGYLYLNLGRVKLQKGHYDSAIQHINLSLRIREKKGDKNAQAACLKYLGDAYLKKGAFNTAFAHYEKAQNTYDLNQDKHLLGNLKVNLSRAYMGSGRLVEAQQNAEKALLIAEELHSLSIMEGAYQVLSEIAYKKRQFESSALLLQKAMVYQDSINSQGLQDQLDRFNFSMEKLQFKYDKEIVRLQEKQNRITYALIFGFLIAIILVVVRVNYLIKKKNISLSRKNDEINSLSKMKKDLISMIAHDLKNPLHSIIGMTQKAIQEHNVHYIRQSGRDMLNLITNMLEVNRMEEKEINLHKRVLSLNQKVQQSIQHLGFLISQKGHIVNSRIKGTIYVEADEQYLERVLTNLLSNAIKFTQQLGQITISSTIEDDCIKVQITDDGEGISEHLQEKIFDKFWSKTDNGQRTSSGLGLTFCKMAIEAHGGEIGVHSVQGEGTTFWFTLQYHMPMEISEDSPLHLQNVTLPRPSSEEDKILLQCMNELSKYRIYEISKINISLRSLPYDKSKHKFIGKWVRQVEKAYQNGDEVLYNRITHPNTYQKAFLEGVEVQMNPPMVL